MKKMRTILTGTMLVLTLSMLTACGNNGNTTSDEMEKENGDTTEKNDNDDKNNENDVPEVSKEADRNDGVDDAALDNGDTMSEGTGNEDGETAVTQEENSDGTVAGDLGNGVKDLGDGVGDAVEDVGDAVGNALDGDEQGQ